MWLQDTEEASGFLEEFVEVDRLGHEDVGACLENFLFSRGLAADCDDCGAVAVVGFDSTADFDAVNAGNHDVQDQEIRFQMSSRNLNLAR